METTETINVTLTPDEVKEIITNHFKEKGIELDNVRFSIGTVYDDGDWRGAYPSSVVTEVICSGTKKIEI